MLVNSETILFLILSSESLGNGNPNHNLGRYLCFEKSTKKMYHSQIYPQNSVPIAPQSLYPQGSMPRFFTYSDQQSDCSVYNIQQRAGSDNYVPSRRINIPTSVSTLSVDAQSIASGQQQPPTIYRLAPAAEGYSARQSEPHGYTNQLSSTVSTTIYDDLSASSYHAVTPMLVRLPAGETGIILCHRPDSISQSSVPEKKQEERGPPVTRRLPSPPPFGMEQDVEEGKDDAMKKRLQNTKEPYVLR